jgi:hypothetical protein
MYRSQLVEQAKQKNVSSIDRVSEKQLRTDRYRSHLFLLLENFEKIEEFDTFNEMLQDAVGREAMDVHKHLQYKYHCVLSESDRVGIYRAIMEKDVSDLGCDEFMFENVEKHGRYHYPRVRHYHIAIDMIRQYGLV